jgi:hypothetical protein
MLAYSSTIPGGFQLYIGHGVGPGGSGRLCSLFRWNMRGKIKTNVVIRKKKTLIVKRTESFSKVAYPMISKKIGLQNREPLKN